MLSSPPRPSPVAVAWGVRDVEHDAAVLGELERPGVPEDEREVALWRAVLVRAVADAFDDEPKRSCGSPILVVCVATRFGF